MEKTIEITNDQVESCLVFIKEYRDLEDRSYDRANILLESIFRAKPKYQVNHIKNQWQSKKKDFGLFFGNLDIEMKICIYNYFGTVDPEDEKYLRITEENPIARLWAITSNTYVRFNNLIMFFNNHGINEKPDSWLELITLPEDTDSTYSFDESNPRYGNSKNWGNYLINLPLEEQKRVIKTILQNYQIDNYYTK